MLSTCFNRCIKLSKHIKKTLKEYQKLDLLLLSVIGKKQTFHQKKKKDWKKFELNNRPIALNILFVPYNNEEGRLAYKSKYNLKHKNQALLLMITDGKNGIILL